MLERIKTSFVKFIAASHTVGASLYEGIDAIQHAQTGGWKTTLSLWAEKNEAPEVITEKYLAALNAIHKMPQTSTLSIKPAALQFNKSLCNDVIALAKQFNIQLQFDAELPTDAAQSLSLFESAFARYNNIGYTLPARWKRSTVDIKRIIEMEVPVRIVKGQWNETIHPVHNVREIFLQLVQMFSGKKNIVSIATHDMPLALAALKVLRKSGTQSELEQMFGLPKVKIPHEMVLPVQRRMYIPYGYSYLPYNCSFVKERPEIIYWIIRDCCVRRKRKKNFLAPVSNKNSSSMLAREQLIIDNHLQLTVVDKS